MSARSCTPWTPAVCAQCAQQNVLSPASVPWPMIRQPQWAQRGASAWMAHSKLSNTWRFPAIATSKARSYSFPQTSHVPVMCRPPPPAGRPPPRPAGRAGCPSGWIVRTGAARRCRGAEG